MRFVAAVILACAAAAVTAATTNAQQAPCVPSESIVCTPLGAVRGVIDGEVAAFRRIPYAQPPTGALRWRPPQPPRAWSGVLDGTAFGPPCPQPSGGGAVVGDEDCLFVNVSAPRRRDGQLLPVMVYLTGGGNFGQSGQGGGGALFAGTRLVPEGVVLVTMNIRLGALGFLTHPALDAEDPRHTSGNYGNQDHVAMLRWIQANIRAFSGDPARVFLFGTSAGGANICGLMTNPAANGLFHGAAMESSVPTGCEFQTRSQVQATTGASLVKAVGCDTAADVAQCLRRTSARDLVTALPAVTNLFPRTYGPVVDGVVFPEQPRQRIARGDALRIPVIIGNNSEEASGWLDDLGPLDTADQVRAAVDRVLGADAAREVFREYEPQAFATPKAAFIRVATDALFTCRTRSLARTIAGAGAGPVYRYLYTYHLQNRPEAPVGHSAEMPFVFQVWSGPYTPGPRDLALSDHMVGWWTRMAKAGDPNGAGAIPWQPASATGARYMQIDVTPGMRDGEADAHCDFWDRVPLRSPHL